MRLAGVMADGEREAKIVLSKSKNLDFYPNIVFFYENREKRGNTWLSYFHFESFMHLMLGNKYKFKISCHEAVFCCCIYYICLSISRILTGRSDPFLKEYL